MRLSFIFITNNGGSDILDLGLRSVMDICGPKDEIIVVGDTSEIKLDVIKVEAKEIADSGNISKLRNMGVEKSTGDIIINCDDDILFPKKFKINLIDFLQFNPTIDVLNTRIHLPNGGRYWDRAVYHNKFDTELVDYDVESNKLFFCGTFLIRKRHIAEKYKFNEDILYYNKNGDNEDVELSKRLKDDGYPITIDLNNYVIHYDNNYRSVVDRNNKMFVIKQDDFLSYDEKSLQHIYDMDIKDEIRLFIRGENERRKNNSI